MTHGSEVGSFLEGPGLVCVRHVQRLPAEPGLALGGCLCPAGVGMTALQEMSKVSRIGRNQEPVSVFLHVEEGMAEDHRSLDCEEKDRSFQSLPSALSTTPIPAVQSCTLSLWKGKTTNLLYHVNTQHQ